MPEFRLTQISETHLTRRLQKLTDNFDRIGEYIDARRPDLVVNSGDLAFDGPTSRDDLEFAKTLHAALPVACRYFARQSRHRRQPGQCRPRSVASRHGAGSAGVSFDLRRGPLAL